MTGYIARDNAKLNTESLKHSHADDLNICS